MGLGQRLFDLRKQKQLSQEEVAEQLAVTRQTISKWETDQSTPDFDKIVPLCKLYGITADELLTGNFVKVSNDNKKLEEKTLQKQRKKAQGIGLSILLYFISIIWVMISIPVLRMNPIVASAIFLLICGVATCIIVYVCIFYRSGKKEVETRETKIRRQIEGVMAIITAIIYLVVSFQTMAFHVTWILWVVFGLACQILKLIFMLRGDANEK